MLQFLERSVLALVGRLNAPLAFRFLLQPTVAVILGIRRGQRDLAAGRPIHLWSLLTNRSERHLMFLAAWTDIGQLCLVAFLIDIGYQLVFLHWLYPLQAIIVMFTLAVVPYALVREVMVSLRRV